MSRGVMMHRLGCNSIVLSTISKIISDYSFLLPALKQATPFIKRHISSQTSLCSVLLKSDVYQSKPWGQRKLLSPVLWLQTGIDLFYTGWQFDHHYSYVRCNVFHYFSSLEWQHSCAQIIKYLFVLVLKPKKIMPLLIITFHSPLTSGTKAEESDTDDEEDNEGDDAHLRGGNPTQHISHSRWSKHCAGVM